MKKKRLLARLGSTCLVLALAALVFMTACAKPAPIGVHWDLNISGSPRLFTAGVEKFVELIGDRTGGNFVIEMHYGAELSPIGENLDADLFLDQ